jgi:3',5'-cyclic AMP phosphodiesterase CpdA
MKLTLFHFSDSHWIPKWIDPTTKRKYGPRQVQVEFYSDYIRDFEALDLTGYYGDRTLLVHTGDFADLSPRKDKTPVAPIRQQFDDIKKRHLITFTRKFKNIDGKLAVPGNHDADRSAGRVARFRDFRNALEDWKTPFNDPVVRFPIEGLGNKRIALFLFNSVSMRKDEKTGKMCPEIAVDRAAMCRSPRNTDYFRIALLHHNLLPHYGQRAKRDVFTNNGNFNTYLGDNNFKLVLSGHQHLGNEMFFAVPEQLDQLSFARPTLESVFLSLAAPSFLRAELVALLGFNIVEVEIPKDSNFATISLSRIRYSRERHARKFFTTDRTVFQVLLPRIDSVGLTPPQQARRIEVARKVVDRFYDGDFDITRIEELMFPFARTHHFEKVRRALQVFQHIPNNVAAMYSVAVLRPSYWWQAESVFRRVFIENLSRAANRGRGRAASPTFLFRFSVPLLDAIQSSRSNARALRIADEVRARKRNLGQWCESIIADPARGSSISVWGVEAERKEHTAPRTIVLQSTRNEIPQTVPDWDKVNSPDTLEIARVAIWPSHFFDTEDASRVIEFHEDCLVPLFWLDPKRLLSATGTPRKHWGYILIYARKHRDPDAAGEQFAPQRRALRYINDSEGVNPIQHFGQGKVDSYANDLWGPNGAPAHYRRNNTYLSAEFSTLLRRPDILFAIDAYALHRAGALVELGSSLNQIHRGCQAWLAG